MLSFSPLIFNVFNRRPFLSDPRAALAAAFAFSSGLNPVA
jgi:hypothetical protein